jgi:hypothetical protein
MKIPLEYPYSTKWKSGYIVTNTENRKTVILFNSKHDRSSVSYARYLMAVHMGRFLDASEHVDHIDDDKTHDVVSNLQILYQAENNKKASTGLTMVELVCGCCGIIFTREKRQMHGVRKTISCSRKCSANQQFGNC